MQKSIFSLCIALLALVQISWAQSYVVSGIEKQIKKECSMKCWVNWEKLLDL